MCGVWLLWQHHAKVAEGVNSHVCTLVIALVGTRKILLMRVFVLGDGK